MAGDRMASKHRAGFFTAALVIGLVLVGSAHATSFVGGSFPPQPGLGLARNNDGEPNIAVAPDGTLWASAFVGLDNNDPRVGVGVGVLRSVTAALAGDDIWRSTDGGRRYQWMASPFNLIPGEGGVGGDDTDITVARARNALGDYTVYASSLWGVTSVPGIGVVSEISLAVSRDNGHSWIVDPAAAEIPINDRPWVAADGACTVYLTYHALPIDATIVNKYDLCSVPDTAAGVTTIAVASSRYLSLAAPAVLGQPANYVLAGFGKLVVDTSATSRYRHRIYIPAMDCASETLTQLFARAEAGSSNCLVGNAVVYVLVGSRGGTSWALHTVTPTSSPAVPIWPDTIATDAAGAVYIAWHQNHDAYLDVSRDGGNTWSTPKRINPPDVPTAVYPAIAAGHAGVVKVAFYGTTVAGDANATKVMGTSGAPGAAQWRVYLAESSDSGSSFTTVAASPVIHTGALCTQGDACSTANTRDLFDDFGTVLTPSGSAAIDYTSDQPQGDLHHDFAAFATELP
jgi:hypothetical protein